MNVDPIDAETAYMIRRTYACPAQSLYDAFLDASVLKTIWRLKAIEIESATVGGTATATMPDDYKEWNFVLTYKELDPPKRLRWFSHFPTHPNKEIRVTVDIRTVDGGAELTFVQENFETSHERDANRQANTGALEKLEKLLD